MKHILFIAPHSFPIKSSESICNSKVAYALASAGYVVDVYCSAQKSTYIEESEITKKLSNHPNINIFSIEYSILNRKEGIKKFIKNILHYGLILLKSGYYYNGIDFPHQCIQHVIKRKKENPELHYDTIITRGFNTDYAGVYLKKFFNAKWIANWNDPYPVTRFPHPYGNGYNSKLPIAFRKLHRDIQKYADIHTFPSERLRNYMLLCFTGVTMEQTRVIPHMAHTMLLPIHKQSDSTKTLKISHVGSVEYPRSPENFLRALANVIHKTSIKINCTFIGNYDSNVRKIINDYNLTDYVTLQGGLPYAKALEVISSSDLSLIIEALCQEGIYLPTKFVDSVQSLTPVLCVSPSEGTLRDLVNQNKVGYWCNNESIENIEECLLKVISDYTNHNLPTISLSAANYFFEDNIVNIYKSII